jgi:hypothetical protein
MARYFSWKPFITFRSPVELCPDISGGLILVAPGDKPGVKDKDLKVFSFGVYFCGEANKNYDKTIPTLILFGSGLSRLGFNVAILSPQ